MEQRTKTETLNEEIQKLKTTLKSREKEITNLTVKLNCEKRKPPNVRYKKEYFEKCGKCKIDKLKSENEYLNYLAFMFVLYIILISVISILKNKLLFNDIFSFITGIFQGINNAVKELWNCMEWISSFAYKIPNIIIADILYWVIIIVLILIFLIFMGTTIFFAGKSGIKLLKEKWDKFQTMLCMVTTTIIIYFTDMINIKNYFDINIVFLGILTIVILTAIRVVYENKKNNY